MNITHKQAVLLFQELGYRNADKYTVDRLNTKLAEISQHFTNDEPMETDAGRALLKQVFEVQTKGEAVTVTAEPTEAPPAETPKKKSKAAAAPAPEPAAAPVKPSAEEEEDEAEAQAAKAAAEAAHEAAAAPAKPAKGKKKDAGRKAEEIVKASAKPAAKATPAPAPAKKKAKPADEAKETIPVDAFGNRVDSDLAKINKCVSTKPKDLTQLTKESGVRRGRVRRQMRKLVARKKVKKDKDGNFTLAS